MGSSLLHSVILHGGGLIHSVPAQRGLSNSDQMYGAQRATLTLALCMFRARRP
jgi:hypothetical protein